MEAWRRVGAKGASARKAWERRLALAEPGIRAAFERGQGGDITAANAAIAALKQKFAAGEAGACHAPGLAEDPGGSPAGGFRR